MKKSWTVTGTVALGFALVLLVLPAEVVMAQPEGGRGPGIERFLDDTDLTEEQKTAILDTSDAMRKAGATREEIRQTVDGMLAEYGVEPPTRPERGARRGQDRLLCRVDLTEEQRTSVLEMVDEMEETGASRYEIREAVDEMLEGYGVALPPRRGGGGRGRYSQDTE